ncbi:DUF4124 domain-containing protein [Microbulbifer sp. OS29]|uniref:DUF4124 domain-containing protein n=1 Tax=Microbulbifer okhotskensis TaxID=2926617 RepID=A0A9X2EJA7_9GAMM|nr:DUF4124 domain-containing protein [Microbulbifer okhotskensis]MCO1332726.1 DUF4124 domain-containing protein [Microbulbifer okhotskensis]
MGIQRLLRVIFLATPLVATAGTDGGSETGAIYKVTGPDGQVTFSDTPPPSGNSEKVELAPINIQPIALPRELPRRKLSPSSDEDEALGPVSIRIVSPLSEATIPPGQTLIALQVEVAPQYPKGASFYAIIDGQRWQGSSGGESLDISALERGAHSVQVVLVGAKGQRLAQSPAITIYVKRPIARG